MNYFHPQWWKETACHLGDNFAKQITLNRLNGANFFFAWQEDKYNFFSFFVFAFCLLMLLLFFLLSVQRLLSMTRKGRLSCWTWSIGNNFLGKNTDGFGMSIFLWALDILLVIAFTLKSVINLYECFLLFHVLLITSFIMGEILWCTHVWNQFFFSFNIACLKVNDQKVFQFTEMFQPSCWNNWV